MIDDLKHSIEVIGEKEAKEQQIRFSLLVSQIDPHLFTIPLTASIILPENGVTKIL